jgi:hypothetical protein
MTHDRNRTYPGGYQIEALGPTTATGSSTE